jgi:MFS family permease
VQAAVTEQSVREPEPVAASSASPTGGSWIRDVTARGPRRLLAWQALTTSVGYFLALAIMVLYLVGPAGLSPTEAAVTLAVGAGGSLVLTIPVGRLVRHLGARRFILLSLYTRAALLALLPAVQPHWAIAAVVVAIGIAETAAFGIYQIIIVQIVGEEARSQTVAVRRTLCNIGFALAAGLTALVVGFGTRPAYTLAFLGSAIALVVSAGFVHALPRRGEAVTDTHESPRGVASDPRYLVLILAAAITATSVSLLTVGVPIWVLYHTTASHSFVGLLMAVNAMLVIVFQVRVAVGATHLPGARRLVTTAGILFGTAMVAFAFSDRATGPSVMLILLVATVLASFAEMCDSAAWWTISYELAPASRRGEYLAAFDAINPLASMVGPPLMIFVVTHGALGWLGYAVLFLLTTACIRVMLVTRVAGTGAQPHVSAP